MTINQAQETLKRWAMVWDFISDENPDVVISSAGDYVTNEAIEWIKLIKKYLPEANVRYTNVCKLTSLWIWTEHHSLTDSEFDEMFTEDKKVIFSYHWYANDVKKLVFWHEAATRFQIFGYEECGSTTTPLDMLIRNEVSRYHIAMNALKVIWSERDDLKESCTDLIIRIENKLKEHKKYILENWVDPDDLAEV